MEINWHDDGNGGFFGAKPGWDFKVRPHGASSWSWIQTATEGNPLSGRMYGGGVEDTPEEAKLAAEAWRP